jgi:carbon-monoxide dehydrogenase large subunit
VATLHATRIVKQKVRQIAAHLLEASPEDIEIADGRVQVRGVPARAISLGSLAYEAYMGQTLPEGMEAHLEAKYVYDPPGYTFSCAAHVAVVEVDPETWLVTPRSYFVMHDCGTVINPRQVEGQLHGGVVAGLGEAFFEELVYDRNGQLMVQTLMDYLVPTMNETMPMVMDHMETPSPFSANGAKGAAEGGLIGAPAAFICAVADAIRPLGLELRQCPATPRVLFELARTPAVR